MKCRIGILKKLNRNEEMLALTSTALQYDPKDNELYYYQGYGQVKFDLLDQAYQSFKQCIKMDRKNIKAY